MCCVVRFGSKTMTMTLVVDKALPRLVDSTDALREPHTTNVTYDTVNAFTLLDVTRLF